MERESFEDGDVARILNENYVPVKVDREERPDVDAVYMAVCQAMTGQGGWPLTILMTPEQEPFFAGTYLPKTNRYGRTGLTELLQQAASLWRDARPRITAAGASVREWLSGQSEEAPSTPDRALLDAAAAGYAAAFDPEHGGFGGAPKFPTPHNLLFLLRRARLAGDADAGRMVERTLTQMARGGIHDHIGGGFSRYSTDERWLAPHFEKMLYDNALLILAYLEAYTAAGRPFYRAAAERALAYVLRELAHPAGGFYCGQDADSDGVEGKFYVFTPAELEAVLGAGDAARFARRYDISAEGNFEGKNIPNLLSCPEYEETDPYMTALLDQLYHYRLRRTALHLDDKLLTSWNGLMIAALARAYVVLGDGRYLDAAQRAVGLLRERMVTPDGRLRLRWREGEAAGTGHLDDYAFLAWGLLELYAADFDPAHLTWTEFLAGVLLARFRDAARGGFYLTADDAEALITRPKDSYDGALPSGNAVAAHVLERLAVLTGESRWREAADAQMDYLGGQIARQPMAHGFGLYALTHVLYPAPTLIAAAAEPLPAAGLHAWLSRHPGAACLVLTPETRAACTVFAPYTVAYPIPEAGVVYYLCRDGACLAPVTRLEDLPEDFFASASSNGGFMT